MNHQHSDAGLRRRDFLAASAIGCAAGVTAATIFQPALARVAPPPSVPLIDSHTHFYDPARPEGVPWPPKNDAVLYRPVFPREWERLVEPIGPAGTIVVEASPWIEDNQWLLDLAERHAAERQPGMLGIVGVVGNLPLDDADCGKLVDRFAASRLFRGIRTHGDKVLAGLQDATYADHVALLVERDLTLDLNGGDAFAAADSLARRFPKLRIVIDHLGNTRIASDGPTNEWLAAVGKVAGHPNVFMKVSGLVESAARSLQVSRPPTQAGFYTRWLDATWKAFGEQRLLFGSNWPVADRAASYADVHALVASYVRGRGAEAERWFFNAASQAAYRWG